MSNFYPFAFPLVVLALFCFLFCLFVLRSVYISKNEAPGRLCHKDVVAEAAEAWGTLQKQHRRDGLYRRSLLPPPSFLTSSADDMEVVSERPSSTMSVDGDEEGISFAPAASLTARPSLQGGSSAASEYLAQDSDTDGADHEDLTCLPSISELEESVDIPFSSTIFEHSAGQMETGSNGGAAASAGKYYCHIFLLSSYSLSSNSWFSFVFLRFFFVLFIPAKSSSSRPSNGRSRKSLGSAASVDADNYFDDSSIGASSSSNALCIPGSRKGSFIPVGAAAHNGTYNQTFDWEDKRIMYASPEEMLQYRANVEYVLLEDVTLEDFKNCVVEGKFKPSRCPLPLPTLQSEASSPVKASAPVNKELKGEIITTSLYIHRPRCPLSCTHLLLGQLICCFFDFFSFFLFFVPRRRDDHRGCRYASDLSPQGPSPHPRPGVFPQWPAPFASGTLHGHSFEKGIPSFVCQWGARPQSKCRKRCRQF